MSLQLTASDANNATLTYSATGLPPGLSISSSTGLISGTIGSTADSNSPYSVTVTATDSNHNSVSQAFNWTVARVSLNPVDDQENQEDTSVSLQLSASDNAGTPTYSATGLPSGLSINSSTGLISGTAGIGSYGSSPYQVTVTATDGTATSSQSFVWTVTPRVALVNPGPQNNATGDSVSLQLSATSPGGTMRYSASGLPAGLSINASSGLISGTPTTASSTPYNVTVTANDGTSSSSQTFPWTVSVINLVSPGDQTNNDRDPVSLSLTKSYHGSGTLSYSATGLPTGLSINSSTGQITGTISGTADTASPYPATVSVTDGTNTSSQTFNWTVNAVVSIDSIDDQTDAMGDTVSMQVGASDANSKTLTYSASGLPTGLSINSSTGVISGTIAVGADTNSPYSATVTATDSAGNSASLTFNWTVMHVSLVNPGAQLNVDGAKVSLQLYGGDADGDRVTYTASGLPSGLSINGSTGLISGTIASNADINSPYAVTVTVSDGTHTATQTFLWTVAQVSLSAPSDQTNTEGDTVSLQLQGLASSGTLSYSASGLPPGPTLNTTSGLISGTIAAGDAANGPYTVDVSAMNGTVSTSYSFTWTVNPVVNPTAPADQSNKEGDNVSLQIAATDSLRHSLSYTASGLPSGLSINSSTGLISGTVSTGDAANSPYVVSVTATDGTYSSSVVFAWTVTHTDTTALSMTKPATQVNVTGDSVNLPINASDPDGKDSLNYSATGLPDGLAIDPYTGLISGVMADDAYRSTPYSVTVTADDGNGQTINQTFTMIVNPPAITAKAYPISAVEGTDTGGITVATFTTPDLDAQAGDFTATINWGDGSSDYGVVTGQNGSFTVTGDHTYAEKGSYSVSITITDNVTGGVGSATTAATVSDASLTINGGFQLGDPWSYQPNSFILAEFTDANPNAPLTDFSAQINWGDGSPVLNSSSCIQQTPEGSFIVVASHTYPDPWAPPSPDPATYTVSVTVTDTDGASASTTSTIVVGDIQAQKNAGMDWSFNDANPYATTGDFVVNGQHGMALVNWGDGTSNTWAITGGPGNGSGFVSFAIQASHVYADSIGLSPQRYQVTVTVTDVDGNTLTGIEYVSVTRPQVSLDTDNLATPANSLSLTNVQVAAFSVPDSVDGTGEFSATINWGDNSSSSGTIEELGPGLFGVVGSHTYSELGLYHASVDVSQNWTEKEDVAQDWMYIVVGTLPLVGPPVVPGNSVYTFFAPLVGQVVNPNNPWTITTIPGAAGNATPKILLWGKTVAPYYVNFFGLKFGKAMSSLFVDIQFPNSAPPNPTPSIVAKISVNEMFAGAVIPFAKYVSVVRVVPTINTANEKTVFKITPGTNNVSDLPLRVVPDPKNGISWVLRHYYGDEVKAFTFTGDTLGNEQLATVMSSTVRNQPAFKTEIPVKLIPPSNFAGVITSIEVGLIQNARTSGFADYPAIYPQRSVRRQYIGGTPAGGIAMLDWMEHNPFLPMSDHVAENTSYKDYAPETVQGEADQWPWYNHSTARWGPDNSTDTSGDVSFEDTPGAYFPNNVSQPLSSGSITYSYDINLSARTKDQSPQFFPTSIFGLGLQILPMGYADHLYYSEAFTSWTINFSAIDFWSRGLVSNIVGDKNAWQSQTIPFPPQINVIPANIGGFPPFLNWKP